MTSDVHIFRKRLNRWKNIGVWLVFISVGVSTFSAGYLKIKGTDLTVGSDELLHNPATKKWVILGLVFGGLNIVCQVIACLIMLSATVQMKKLT